MSAPHRSRRAGVAAIAAVLVVLSIAAPSVPASAAAEAPAEAVSARSFEIRHRPLADAVDLVSAVLSEDGSVSLRPRLRRIVVQDREAVLDRVARVLSEFDLPPRNVEVAVSLFLGTDRRDDEAGRLARSPDIAEETRGIRETLSDFTKWTEFAPLGTQTITCVEGFEGTVYLADDYRVEFRVQEVEGEDRVLFDRFRLLRSVPTADGGERTVKHYDAAIRMPVGQELLVGAASGPDASAALFLKLLVRVN
jgi:hypothetical protein